MKRIAIEDNLVRGAMAPAAWWIRRTIAHYEPRAMAVADLEFERLPRYFSPELLKRARVISIEPIPLPPLSRTAVRLLSGKVGSRIPFDPAGITYGHLYFIAPELIEEESIHFHELIHVIQWETLGIERFLWEYAKGYLKHGYRDCPLEEMAYRHEERFRSSEAPYDVEVEVRQELVLSKWNRI